MNDAISLLPCEEKKLEEERKIRREAKKHLVCSEPEKGLAEKPKPIVLELK